jgi:hypothetical protein
MNHIFDFLRSDLFLSLAAGFALGVAGLALAKPASARELAVSAAQPFSNGVSYEIAR